MQIKSLTSLRFFAALLVFLSHNQLVLSENSGLQKVVNQISLNGYVGVTIFFILSGFILTLNYSRNIDFFRLDNIKFFYISRFARIYPMYFFALIITLLSHFKNSQSTSGWLIHALTLQTWSADMNFAFAFNGPGWSVGVETFLYLCFPFFLFLFKKTAHSNERIILYFLIFTTVIILNFLYFEVFETNNLQPSDKSSAHRWLYRNPIFRIPDFCIGICAALFFQKNGLSEFSNKITLLRISLFSSILFMLSAMSMQTVYLKPISFDALYFLPITAIIVSISYLDSVNKLHMFNNKVFVKLGEISYTFFLIQWPLGSTSVVGNLLHPVDISLSSFELSLRYFIGLVALLLASWVLFEIIEKPSRRYIVDKLCKGARRNHGKEPIK